MQTPVEYQTVFTVLQKTAPSSQELMMVPVVVLVVGIVVGFMAIIQRRASRGLRPSMVMIACGLLVLFAIYFLHSVRDLKTWNRETYDRAKTVYLAGQYSVVEGPVTNFHPMPSTGHQNEAFLVNGAQFSYSDFDGSPCFNNTASHGGPIREGISVRIAYWGNCILKLEVAANSLREIFMAFRYQSRINFNMPQSCLASFSFER